MEDELVFEPATTVVAAAEASGFKVSPKMRSDYHRAGVLPRPVMRSLGRARGREAQYPSGTSRQLVRLCELLSEDRDLRRAGIRLWLEGYPVSPEFVRTNLHEAIGRWETEIASWFDEDGDGDQSDKAWGIIETAADARMEPGVLRRARRRTSRKRFSAFTALFMRVASGRFNEFWHYDDDNDVDILARGMGWNQSSSLSREWPPSRDVANLEHDLCRVASLLSGDGLRSALNATSDDELTTARDELLTLRHIFTEAAPVAEKLGIVELSRIDDIHPDTALFLTAGWLSLRQQPEVITGYLHFTRRVAPLLTVLRNSLDSAGMLR